ncbi:MAG: hypothetical protein V1735_04160 [Nanoarchaeota archaeon]
MCFPEIYPCQPPYASNNNSPFNIFWNFMISGGLLQAMKENGLIEFAKPAY